MPEDHRPSPLADVMAPLSRARGLPNAHYTDAETVAAEARACLKTTWMAMGVAAEVGKPGDALPRNVLGQPLLMLRDDKDRVRVFYNVCRHRGMILVEEQRQIRGAIRCPYHSWCYAKDGRLVATPHVGGPGQNADPAIERATLGLVEVRSHIWRDVVFVDLSGEAADFDVAHRDLIERWAEFDCPLIHGGPESSFTLDVATNWKLAVENYCESYHLPWVHPGLNAYSRLEDHYHIEAPGRYSGQGTHVYRQIEAEDGGTFPDFEGLSPFWDEAAEYVALYPNVLLGVHRDHAFAIVLEPLSHERTREHIHLYYACEGTDGALRAENARRWKEVFEEDITVVEGMQRGRAAAGFDGGRFSPAMDGPTHCFHAWVAGRMAEHETG